MTRRIRIAALLAAAAMTVSACAGATVAANVNGSHITDDEVLGIRAAGAVEDGDAGTVQGEQFRNDLNRLIVIQSTIDAAEEDFGITGLETTAARDAWLAEASPEELSVIDSVASNPDLSDAAVELVTVQLMVRSAVMEAMAIDPETLSQIWQDEQELLINVCPRHILVATQDEAEAARQRVLAGEDFSAVADEISLDPVSVGGQLECPSNPTRYVEPLATVFATAPVGEVTLAFQSDYGWHIAIVDQREGPATYEDFIADTDRWLPDSVLAGRWTIWSNDALERADISVRSQIGRWFPQGDGVLPPPASP
jgi:hypothetical protein